MPPNRISHYIIAFITSGNGTKIIGNNHFEICENMALVFPKNIIHSTNTWSMNTSGFMLSFNESLFEEYQFPVSFIQLSNLFKHSILPYKIFNKNSSSIVLKLFNDLCKLQNSTSVTDRKLFILKLSELLIKYEEEFNSNALRNEKESLYDNFADLVEEKYKHCREVKYYAELLSIHPNYLNKLVRSVSKLSAKEFIHHRVFHEAKYLLSATSIPIKEIAFELGFSNYNYFSRLFKIVVKQTPAKYRKTNV